MLKRTLKIIVILIIGLSILSRADHAGTGPSAKANAMLVLNAMEEELSRSMKNLGKDGNPAPYFISYRMTDSHLVFVSASDGALRESGQQRTRLLDVEVRVGDHKLDNSHRIRGSRAGFGYDYSQPVMISLDDDPAAIKSSIWLETDKNYKNALEKLIQIKTNQHVNVKEEDHSDDFSKETAYREIGEPVSISVDTAAWEKKLKEYSQVFKDYPEIYVSELSLRAEAENKYFVNSDGVTLLHGQTHWQIIIVAGTKADDGMKLEKGITFEARTPTTFPDETQIKLAVMELIYQLMALRRAPTMEPYTGPAILSGRASAVFFHEIFGHRIEGHRQKNENEGQTFAKEVNHPILPPFISVYDDPGLTQYKSIDLNGHYIYDDEGMKAQRVDLVKDGILKNFLMSRSPIQGFSNSNGHGRAQAGLPPVSRQGNLVVEASKTETWDKLRSMLIEECKRQGKPYGLIFDDISGGSTATMRFSTQSFDVVPIIVLRVFVDGRPDQLVRGVNLIGTPLTSFSKIIACGDQPGIFNGYCGAESGTVPVSAISPAILTSQIEVQKRYKESDKPPVLPPPPTSATPQTDTNKNKNDKDKNDPLITAMKDEMTRSMSSLKIEHMEKPYYLEYTVWDRWQMMIDGSFGALLSSGKNKQRLLKVDLRVGDYKFDNSGFMDGNMYPGVLDNADSLVLDNDYRAIRKSIWLVTDDAYKRAIEQLAGKGAVIRNQVKPEEIPDFSKSETVHAIAPRKTIKIEQEKWENLVRNLSAIFREFPDIHQSGVEMEITLDHKYYINSEGTVSRQPQLLVSLIAMASTQAPDGMRLTHYVPFLTTSMDQLPPETELAAKVREMAQELTALRSAPVVDNYIGPVLFTQQASTELFAQALSQHFSGQRPPLSDSPQMPDLSTNGKLSQRINRRVMPSNLSVKDDPTQSMFENIPLVGSYHIDDEGILSRPVALVEKGILKTLLMSRRPRKDIPQSNGHGRAAFFGEPGVQVGNLFFTSEAGKPFEQLKRELMQLCKDQQLPYGLLIKTVDNPAVTGMELSMSAGLLNSAQPDGQISAPILMYRIDTLTGKEELVRGIVASEINVKDLKYMTGIGNDYYVNNRILPPGGSMMDSAYLFRARTNMGIPASIIAPSVLFDEIEFKSNGDGRKKPPILKHPFFDK